MKKVPGDSFYNWQPRQNLSSEALSDPSEDGSTTEVMTTEASASRLGCVALESSRMLADLADDLEIVKAYEKRSLEENRDEMTRALEDFYDRNSWLRSSK